MKFMLPIGIAIGLVALGRPSSAQLSFHVQLATGSIYKSGNSLPTDFKLTDGHVTSLGSPDTNNSVVLSNFTFGDSAGGAVISDTGNASGSTASSVSLADGASGGVAEHRQGYTTGSTFGFDAAVTTNADTGGTPDIFTFSLLNSGSPIKFLQLNITGPSITIADVQTFSDSKNGGPAPVVTALATATPEPGSMALGLGVFLCASLTALRRRRTLKR
jgi:hypothetical protein